MAAHHLLRQSRPLGLVLLILLGKVLEPCFAVALASRLLWGSLLELFLLEILDGRGGLPLKPAVAEVAHLVNRCRADRADSHDG